MLRKSKTTIQEIKKLNKESGQHFFDDRTMSFFNLRIESPLYEGGFFITSEKKYQLPRRYTIRQFDFTTYSVKTVGEYYYYDTIKDAELEISDLQ